MAIGLNRWQSGGSDPPFFMPVQRKPIQQEPEVLEPEVLEPVSDVETETVSVVPEEYKEAQTADPYANQPYARFTDL